MGGKLLNHNHKYLCTQLYLHSAREAVASIYIRVTVKCSWSHTSWRKHTVSISEVVNDPSRAAAVKNRNEKHKREREKLE